MHVDVCVIGKVPIEPVRATFNVNNSSFTVGNGGFYTMGAGGGGTASIGISGDGGSVSTSTTSNVLNVGMGSYDFFTVSSSSDFDQSIRSRFVIGNLPNHNSNYEAIAAGLTQGSVYRNGDQLCIVH